MNDIKHLQSNNTISLIYDGKCILCNNCAKALKLKKAVGQLQIIDARSSNPLIEEVLSKGYNLNEGIVVKFKNKYYHGTDAVHLLALLGSPIDLFNRLNAYIFKFKTTTVLCYPVFKLIRNILLFIRRIPKIHTPGKTPLFQSVFDQQWESMPSVLKKRYGNHAYQDKTIRINGTMNVNFSKFFSFISPALRMFGALVPFQGKNIPTTIEFISHEGSAKIDMDRTFYYPDKKPYQFNSRLYVIQNSEVIESIRFGLGLKVQYSFVNGKVLLKHKGYVLQMFGKHIPIPLSFILGCVYAEEEATSEDSFKMLAKVTHPILGRIFEYSGQFKIDR